MCDATRCERADDRGGGAGSEEDEGSVVGRGGGGGGGGGGAEEDESLLALLDPLAPMLVRAAALGMDRTVQQLLEADYPRSIAALHAASVQSVDGRTPLHLAAAGPPAYKSSHHLRPPLIT